MGSDMLTLNASKEGVRNRDSDRLKKERERGSNRLEKNTQRR